MTARRAVAAAALTAALACAPRGAPEHAAAPPAPARTPSNKVSVRDDRAFLVGGEPFFPVGLYYAGEEIDDPSGESLRDLRRAGFNTVFYHGGLEDRAKLDRVAAAGLRVQYRPPGSINSRLDELEAVVTALRGHPALLFWELEDEPLVNGVSFEESRRGRELLKRLDPDHPVLGVQWPDPRQAEALKQWATLCDAYAFDFYPIPLRDWLGQGTATPKGFPRSVAVMGTLTEWWRSLAPGKPVLAVVQAWARRPVLDGEDGYPTYREGRFMAYQVVIRGASGILFFGQIRVSRPNTPVGISEALDPDPAKAARHFARVRELNDRFWSYYRGVVAEVAAMAPIFAAQDAGWVPRVEVIGQSGAGPEDIQHRVKGRGAGVAPVILAVNASDYPATVRITAAPFAGSTVHCWHEAYRLQADGSGAFVDRLDPGDVRVYSTASREVWRAAPDQGDSWSAAP